MKKVAIAAALAGLLLFAGTALADEQKKIDEHSGHGMTHSQPAAKEEAVKTAAPAQTPVTTDVQSHNMTTEEHQNMNMSTDGHQEMNKTADEHKNMTPDEHQHMTTEDHHNLGSTGNSHNDTSTSHEGTSSGGGHGAHKDVVETPPNILVLSSFGAINAAFILFGVWNKWFRKKEGAPA